MSQLPIHDVLYGHFAKYCRYVKSDIALFPRKNLKMYSLGLRLVQTLDDIL